jgi:CBS domain-containing protein/Flp pilus assembly pilin Flp
MHSGNTMRTTFIGNGSRWRKMSVLRKIWTGMFETRGAAPAEYAIVLACVVLLLLASGALLGMSVGRAFTLASAKINVPLAGDPSSHHPFDGESSSKRRTENASAPAPNASLLGLGLMVIGTAVLGTIAALVLRAFLKSKDRQRPKQTVPTEERIQWTRLTEKREVLWRQLLANQDLVVQNRIEVRHVMTDQPLTVSRSTPGKTISEIFTKNRIGHLVVCDGDDRIAGVIQASDHRANPAGCAETVMTPPAVVVSPQTMLSAALSLFFEQGVSFVPVIDGERLCGVLTPTDLVLTLHCSLQLWYRVAQTMQSSAEREADLTASSESVRQIGGQLRHRIGSLPEKVKSAIRSGDTEALNAELSTMIKSVSQLMQQLEEARAQIKKQHSEVTQLRPPTPDEATGAASREELDRILVGLLARDLERRESLSLILYHASCKGGKTAGAETMIVEQLRSAVQEAGECVGFNGHIARFNDDTVGIVLPDRGIQEARAIGARLSEICRPGRDGQIQSRLSIVSARQGESVSTLLYRAETALAQPPARPREPATAPA